MFSYRSNRPNLPFAFRVDPTTKLHFKPTEDTVVEDPKHVQLCEQYVGRGKLVRTGENPREINRS